MHNLVRLAELIHTKNAIEKEIAVLIGRPALLEHVGEYIAGAVFGISYERQNQGRGESGHFTRGPLAGQSVSIKWYIRPENSIELDHERMPNNVLVLVGAKAGRVSALSTFRPWSIDSIFLFDTREILNVLRVRHAKVGDSIRLRGADWDTAEIYPARHNQRLPLSAEQCALLDLFK